MCICLTQSQLLVICSSNNTCESPAWFSTVGGTVHFTLMVGFCLWVFCGSFFGFVLFLIVFCQRQAMKLHACACTAESE